MKRTAGLLVWLTVLSGCVPTRTDTDIIDLGPNGRPTVNNTPVSPGQPGNAGGAVTDVSAGLRRRQPWMQGSRPDGMADITTPGMRQRGPQAGDATTVAGLASRMPPRLPDEHSLPGRDGPSHPAAGMEGGDASANNVAVVSSKRILLNYEVKDVGPSGVASVELWYNHNGQGWQKYPGPTPQKPPFAVDVAEEGLYGFTLVAHNAAGRGVPPPKGNDPPQIAVEVDLTKPVVSLTGVEPDAAGKTVTVAWQATDKNLGLQPIALLWARDAAGPWFPIVTGLENNGGYVWKPPAGLPGQVFVRVEATDLAGNVATAQTPNLVALDLSQPAAAIVAVQPGEHDGRPHSEAATPTGSAPSGNTPILKLESVTIGSTGEVQAEPGEQAAAPRRPLMLSLEPLGN